MRKIILLTIIAAFTLSSYSQQRATLPEGFQHKWVKVDQEQPDSQSRIMNSPPSTPSNVHQLAINEQDIGITYFDRQTNRMLQNRIHRFDDGTVGAVWIYGEDFTAFPDRGTGYNFFDGTAWGPIPHTGLESFRAGWPSYTALGPNGEIVVSHDNATYELCFLTRENKGVGEWNESMYSYTSGPASLNWPRVTSAGTDNNSIHLLADANDPYLGQDRALVYSRSQDGGLTWNIENEVLEGTGMDYYTEIVSDTYAWAEERNGTIAFICASIAFNDMFIMKSTDDGDNWEKTIVWEHPYPFYNPSGTVTDTFFSMDGSASIALGPDGMAHVTFGISRIIKPDAGGGFYLDPSIDGIGYWNENMETFSNDLDALAPPGMGFPNSEMVEDYNFIGWMQDVNGNGTIDLNIDIMWYWHQWGASTMPSITINDLGEVFVIFASTTETYEHGEYNYKHIWGRGYSGGTWHEFVDLTIDVSHLFDECIYPMFALTSDDNLHYIYHVDDAPGLAQGMGTHEHHENRIIYASVPKETFLPPIGISENNSPEDILHIAIYPNPCVDGVNIRYQIPDTRYQDPVTRHASSVTCIDLFGIGGNKIQNLIEGNYASGEYEIYVDVSDLPDGIYFVRFQSGNQVASKKLIVLRNN